MLGLGYRRLHHLRRQSMSSTLLYIAPFRYSIKSAGCHIMTWTAVHNNCTFQVEAKRDWRLRFQLRCAGRWQGQRAVSDAHQPSQMDVKYGSGAM
jgi:hypothetical protein